MVRQPEFTGEIFPTIQVSKIAGFNKQLASGKQDATDKRKKIVELWDMRKNIDN
jgi:hypothetical protein